jgi:hypothetical protein
MIPSFPADATIASIHLACFRTGQHASVNAAIRATYGLKVHIHNQFGFKASSFVERVLHGSMDASELMTRHSMFPLVASIVTSQTADRWRKALAIGDVSAHVQCRAQHAHGIKNTIVLRQCPSCVRDDVNVYGSGHWRVLHQIPVIRFCQTHGELLHDRCAACRTPFVEHIEPILPGEPCARCGSTATSSCLSTAQSQGYDALAKLVERALYGEAFELGPRIRGRLLQHLAASANIDAESLLRRFLKWWGLDSLHELEHQIQCRTEANSALQLFACGHADVKSQFLMAAVAFAWEHTSESDRHQLLNHRHIESDLFSRPAANDMPDEILRDALAALAIAFSLPVQVVDLLASGHRIAAIRLVGSTNYSLLLNGLSPISRAHLERCFNAPHPKLARKYGPV